MHKTGIDLSKTRIEQETIYLPSYSLIAGFMSLRAETFNNRTCIGSQANFVRRRCGQSYRLKHLIQLTLSNAQGNKHYCNIQ